MPAGSLGSLSFALALILVPTAAATRHGGDFNGDGKHDLPVGVPAESFRTATACGAVHVLFGSASGPSSNGALFLEASHLGASNDFLGNFGNALAIGDFDGDRIDDLAIGAPGETVGGKEGTGAVAVLYGTKKGLKAKRIQLWHENKKHVPDRAEDSEVFGEALAAGDFDVAEQGDRFGKAIGG